MARSLYSLLLYLLLPALLLRAAWRGWRARRSTPAGATATERLAERLGFVASSAAARAPLLVHCVSVGETVAAQPLLDALLARGETLWLTSTTLTGAARVQERYGKQVRHSFLPVDTPDAVARFLDRVRPRALLVMETEVWPNLLAACAARNIPAALVNGRLSEKSARGYVRLGVLSRTAFGNFSVIAAQSADDAARFARFTSRPVTVTGNLKFDLIPDLPAGEDRYRWRSQWGGRKVWIAASTHAADEAVVLAAHGWLRKKLPGLLLILVPRHPERFDAVADAVQRAGFAYTRRSRGAVPDAETAVYLADTMGELGMLYAWSDVAFVGGTFSGTGGHNFLEPAALGLPMVSGSSVYNFQSIADTLQASGALRCVRDAAGLAEIVRAWLEAPSAREQAGAAGKAFVAANRGALQRTLAVLEPIL